MATERQIAANRRNARKSCGPRTPAGKARSSRNAITHGLNLRFWDTDPALVARRDALAEELRPRGTPGGVFARSAAEAEIELERIRAARIAIIEEMALRGDACGLAPQHDAVMVGTCPGSGELGAERRAPNHER
jgi:hypothetical protein